MAMRARARTVRLARHVVASGLAVGFLVVGLPAVTGMTLSGLLTGLAAVSGAGLVGLVALWLLGLLAHTITLTAALPSLTHRRALTLSLTGSAVANVLPMGGAAGLALNYRMLRAWGYDGPQFAAYTVVTNIWDVLAKLVVPLLVLPVVLLAPSLVLPHLALVAGTSAGLLVLALAVGVAVVSSRRAASRVGTAIDRVVVLVLRAVGSTRQVSVTQRMVETQESCRIVITHGWGRLSVGMTLYTALLLALLLVCLSLTGAGLPVSVVLAGFAVERLLTLANITPGGAGTVELGLTGVLVLLGGAAAAVVPGVLLYRALTFGLEIPVGGTALIGWLLLRRRSRALVATP